MNRQFRYVPKEKVVDILWCCLAAAVAKHAVRLHEFVYMSNHLHLVLTMDDTKLPEFMKDLGSLTSRALNSLRGISGPNVETHYNAVVVTDPQKCLEHCAYTLANPCTSHLVTRAAGWRSVT